MDTALSSIKGIGPARRKALSEAGINTLYDLIMCLPKEYRDLTRLTPLSDVRAGETCAMRVNVIAQPQETRASKLHITRAMVSDGTDAVYAVWFNQPWLAKTLFVGRELLLYGRAEAKGGRMQIVCPSIETGGGLTPIYKAVGGVPSRAFQKFIEAAFSACALPDELPEGIKCEYGLCDWDYAIRNAHFPASRDALERALYRLSFENLLLFQVAVGLMRARAGEGVKIPHAESDIGAFWKCLPFPPTGAQRRVLTEIANDMSADAAMARMVQGDVGCGKTAVAFGAIALAARSGWQSAMMAPTEILAVQHYESALKILEPMGIKCGLLIGALSQKAHREAREQIISGEWRAVFGTHALITGNVCYQKLGLVITDEQHRFGVRQRTLLGEKGESPNVLVMSATPIPRTLSLILYGDLDISIIDEMPPGRRPVKTRVVPESKRSAMYGFIKAEVGKGRQAYFVCPLVEDSEAVDAQSAQMLYESLAHDALKELRVSLVHGKMRPKEKDAAVEAFRAGETDVLVSTTVIEVGVDVPNASVMVIENAERFGLAQLHQLRGRVGRGNYESWCFLMADNIDKLKILTETSDGFKIAQQDMELRGPGELFGTRQAGALVEGALLAGADAQTLKITHELARALLRRPESDEETARVKSMALMWLKRREGVALAAN